MATSTNCRIDISTNELLTKTGSGPRLPETTGATLPEPVFPQFPQKLKDPGPSWRPERRKWTAEQIFRATRGWLVPYLRSRVLPGEFHPITAYLFLEYKCNLDCWYCPSFDNRVKGMSEDVARRSIDWVHDHGGRVLALMGGEPLLRPKFVHKVVYHA
jgi:sulfatase maturation enzyme AslB (radical SAM superfamily)